MIITYVYAEGKRNFLGLEKEAKLSTHSAQIKTIKEKKTFESPTIPPKKMGRQKRSQNHRNEEAKVNELSGTMEGKIVTSSTGSLVAAPTVRTSKPKGVVEIEEDPETNGDRSLTCCRSDGGRILIPESETRSDELVEDGDSKR